MTLTLLLCWLDVRQVSEHRPLHCWHLYQIIQTIWNAHCKPTIYSELKLFLCSIDMVLMSRFSVCTLYSWQHFSDLTNSPRMHRSPNCFVDCFMWCSHISATAAKCYLVTKHETNGDLKSFLQRQGAFYSSSTDTLTATRKIDIAQQILQGALFLSEQKSVS